MKELSNKKDMDKAAKFAVEGWAKANGKEIQVMNEFEIAASNSIVLSNYCVECVDNVLDQRASFIYQGNSLCVWHFKEAKQLNV